MDEPVFTWLDAVEHFVAGHPGERLDDVLYWPREKFDLLYDTYVRRTVVEELQGERRAQVRAILSNGGYFQSKEGLDARRTEIEEVNRHYDEVIDEIRDPGKAEREERAVQDNPLFAAGIRGLDRLKWDLQAAQGVQAQLGADDH
ncbi:MAG: hypothetical protein H0U53_04320 [Actinobacteria bacterium]|nr:hypothetical protein [Actinomycetota bacterium]